MTIPSLHYLNANMRYVLTIFLLKKKTKSSRIACKLKASVGESIKHVCWLPLTMATSMASVSK